MAPMKILLIAYDFPPIPSPQALRWAYLVRELADAGHDVHVLAPDVEGYGVGGLPATPGSVRVHRVWPGPYAAYVSWRSRRRAASRVAHVAASDVTNDEPTTETSVLTAATSVAAVELNWKGRLRGRVLTHLRALRRGMVKGLRIPSVSLSVPALAAHVMYPDIRAEWLPWASRKLEALLDEFDPDVVVTSHEPANSIPLGLRASRKGYRWVADLGDPLLAPYTPKRWRKHAFDLERAICEAATSITMTSQSAIQSLAGRHPMAAGRCHLLTQGFDQSVLPRGGAGKAPKDTLDILYTGSFYVFRDPAPLINAVIGTERVRLIVATIVAPDVVLRAAAEHPGKFVLLGFVAHRDALALQRSCDLLLNIANDNPEQIPGKLYEYLGSGTPILHVGESKGDAAAMLVSELGVGWCVSPKESSLKDMLQQLRERKAVDTLARPNFDDRFLQYSWKGIAERFVSIASRRDDALLDVGVNG